MNPRHRQAAFSRLAVLIAGLLVVDLGVSASTPTAGPSETSGGGVFFVDCRGGSDGASGVSPGSAWRSLGAVSGRRFGPGDVVGLLAGCVFDGDVVVGGGGVAGAPVVVRGYGVGAAPVVRSRGGAYNAVQLAGPWMVLDGVSVVGARNAGVGVGGSHDVVRGVEVSGSGEGVEVEGGGDHALISGVYAHDLRMVVNTPGGDDDYGATGFAVGAVGVRVTGSTCRNCVAPSDDYGVDGGFVEVFNVGDGLVVDHDLAVNVDGFVEVGAAAAGGSAEGMRFENNVLVDATVAVHVNVGNKYGIGARDLRFENNTFVQLARPVFDVFYGTAGSSTVRNNVFYLAAGERIGQEPAVHTNNLYRLPGAVGPGYRLGAGELMGDPGFVDVAGGDYHLGAGSPAIGLGTAVPYPTDYTGAPLNTPPDAGALQAIPTPKPVKPVYRAVGVYVYEGSTLVARTRSASSAAALAAEADATGDPAPRYRVLFSRYVLRTSDHWFVARASTPALAQSFVASLDHAPTG